MCLDQIQNKKYIGETAKQRYCSYNYMYIRLMSIHVSLSCKLVSCPSLYKIKFPHFGNKQWIFMALNTLYLLAGGVRTEP